MDPAPQTPTRSSGIREFVRLASLFALVALAWALCLRFVFPGYFDPLVPNHTDLYTIPGLSVDRWAIWDYLRWPRPIGFLTLDLMGRLGLRGYLAGAAFAALLNVALIAWLVRRIAGGRLDFAAAALWAALLFTHPSFYIGYLHDTLATLSCLWLTLALHAWYSYRETGRRRHVALAAVLLFLLAFSKETYFASAAVLWFGQLLVVKPAQRKVCAGLLAGLLALEVASLYANAHSINPFLIVSSDPSNPYHISLAPGSVMATLGYYLARMFNPATAALAAAGVLWTARSKERLIVPASLLLAGVCALLPHSVIPNHLDSIYAWVGLPLATAPALFIRPADWRRRLGVCTGLAALLAISIAMNQGRYRENAWTITQERVNAKILASFPAMKRLPAGERKILVTGLKAPYSPFQASDYMRFEFGGGREWTVLVPRDGIEKAEPPVTLLRPEHVNVAEFDHAFAFSEDGRLLREWKREELSVFPKSGGIRTATAVLFPDMEEIERQLRDQPNDWMLLLREGVAFWDWGATREAEISLQRSADLIHSQNPYPLYYLALVRESQGRLAEAQALLEQALPMDSNPAFREALDRVRRKPAH